MKKNKKGFRIDEYNTVGIFAFIVDVVCLFFDLYYCIFALSFLHALHLIPLLAYAKYCVSLSYGRYYKKIPKSLTNSVILFIIYFFVYFLANLIFEKTVVFFLDYTGIIVLFYYLLIRAQFKNND